MNTLTQTIAISKETVAEMPVVEYPGEITLVDTPEMARIALRELTRARVVGFDTETRPSFHRGHMHNVALMQLSTDDHCFLFRLNILGISEPLRKFLEDPEIIKIGLSVHDDFSVMRRLVDDLDPQGFIDLQEYVKFFHINDISLQKIYAIVFREKISKNQRLTNWEAPILTEQQQRYAAIDAWACLRLYRTFRSGQFHPDESPFIVDRSLLCPSEAARHAEAMKAAEEKRRLEAVQQTAGPAQPRRSPRSEKVRKTSTRKGRVAKSSKASRKPGQSSSSSSDQ